MYLYPPLLHQLRWINNHEKIMIVKKAKAFISYIFADKENIPLEHRMFLSTLFIGILFGFFGSLSNLLLTSSLPAILLPFFVSLILIGIFYFVRAKGIIKPFLTPVIIFGIIIVSIIWVFNGGINGSNIMSAFLVLILGLIIVPKKDKPYVFIFFLASYIFILLIQLYRPDLIVGFTTEKARWMDHLSTAILCSVFLYYIIRFIHKNYTVERLRAESGEAKLQKQNADKDRFLAILSHDLRGPFNVMLGLSEVLTEDLHKLKIKEIETLAHNINKTAKNTYDLLEDLLKWAATQQGTISFNPENLSFDIICKEVLKTIGPNAMAKNITIKNSAADQQNIYADADMLKTVLRNVLSNAIKFTNPGGEIMIKTVENSESVTISILDNGIGISADNLKKLFNISEILSTKGTAKESGTGLGLLLCQEFVERHGGRIWVNSILGKGSEFCFSIPCFIEPNKTDISIV